MKPLSLIWTRYENKGAAQYYLLIYIGEVNGNLAGLIADKVPDQEATILRALIDTVAYIDFASVNEFIKRNMPNSYKRAYFLKPRNRFLIEQTYEIGKLKPSKSTNI